MKLKRVLEIFKRCLDEMVENHLSAFSAQCSYYTILSFIPFIILIITLIQYTGLNPQTLIDLISKIIPNNMKDMVVNIVQEVYSKSIGTISVSIIFTIWAAGRGLFALNKGLHVVYKTNDDESASYIYLRIKSIMHTILFIVLIVLGLTFLVFGNSFSEIIKRSFGELANYNLLLVFFAKIMYIFITFIVFLFIYKFMPKHKVTFKSQSYGALLGAVMLNIISFIFSNYLYIFKGFSLTYGSLTTLMLIMMWTYSCFYTVFLGAEFNKIVNKKFRIN